MALKDQAPCLLCNHWLQHLQNSPSLQRTELCWPYPTTQQGPGRPVSTLVLIASLFCFVSFREWEVEVKILFFLRFYLFIFRERKREGEREGEKHQCARETLTGYLSHTPIQGPGLQPRHVPWLGIKLVTFQFAGQGSIHWATLARMVTILKQFKRFNWNLWERSKPPKQNISIS